MKKSETMKKRALNVFFSQSKYISKNLHIPTETLLAEIKNAKGNQTCHGDLNPNGNILYDNDKNKFALIDFEDAFYGPRQFDQIFFIFNSGKDHWLTLLRNID